jgi:hypothetical protein
MLKEAADDMVEFDLNDCAKATQYVGRQKETY